MTYKIDERIDLMRCSLPECYALRIDRDGDLAILHNGGHDAWNSGDGWQIGSMPASKVHDVLAIMYIVDLFIAAETARLAAEDEAARRPAPVNDPPLPPPPTSFATPDRRRWRWELVEVTP